MRDVRTPRQLIREIVKSVVHVSISNVLYSCILVFQNPMNHCFEAMGICTHSQRGMRRQKKTRRR